MPSTFDITAHALLSDESKRLDSEVIDAHTMIAERVLGLVGLNVLDEDVEEVEHALALQVNYQVALPPDVWALAGKGRGARNESYRATLPPVSPQAKVIIDGLYGATGGRWVPFGPRR